MTTTHYKRLTLPRPGSLLSGVPVRISISGDTDIGGRAQSDGSDVRIKTTGGASVDWQIESWVITGGSCTAELWAILPTVPSSSDPQLDLHYGGGAATPDHSTTLSVTDLVAGYHLGESGDGTADEYKDWSGTGNHGTGGSSAYPAQVTGKIHKGQDCDGLNDHIIIPDDVLGSAASWSIVMWLYSRARDSYNSPFGDALTNSNALPTIRYDIGGSGKYQVYAGNDSSFFINGVLSSTVASINTWEHVAIVYDGSDLLLYRDGTLADTLAATNSQTLASAGNGARLGGGGSSSAKSFDGVLDEVRLYAAAKPAAWVAYEHAQQHAPGTWGSEQAHELTAADLEHAQTIDGATLTQTHELTAADLEHAQTIDGATLTQTHELTAADLTHGQTVDVATLTIVSSRAVADLALAIGLETDLAVSLGLETGLALAIEGDREE